MTRRRLTAILWLALVLCAPLPFFLVESGNQPLAATAQMLAATLALMVAEGSAGAISLAAWMLAGQILLGMFLFALLAMVIVRALERMLGRHARTATLLLVALMFLVAATMPIYRTPFRSSGLHATWFEAFE